MSEMTTQELSQAAAAAERVILELEAGRVREAREAARKLDAVVHEAGATGRRDRVEPTVVSALQTRASALAGLATRRAPLLAVAEAANRVRDLVAEQAERFGDPAAAALLRLDYLEREVELRSFAGQHVAAQAAAGAAVDVWADARTAVAAGAGESLAERFDRHLVRLQRHKGPSHIQDEARCGLELLAALRPTFGDRTAVVSGRRGPGAAAA